MTALEITDHALLRWMERVHGIDVETWRALMRAELDDSLAGYEGGRSTGAPGFVISGNRVVTCLDACHKHRPQKQGDVCVPRVA